MKRVLLIVVFCISKLWSQIGSPDLRCIEILPNFFAKLTWLPPADPSSQFVSYEVYFSPTRGGTYSPLNANITSIGTNTFINPVTSHSIQACFYFVLCRYTNGTGLDSTYSDTLGSIFLNATANSLQGNLHLSFNRPHDPSLPSSSPTFTLLKEYPLGSWNILSVPSATVYPDTIDVCEASINYLVKISDASGCISTSNLRGPGPWFDSKNPEEPYVDSVSVLPDGRTCIAWQVPVDRDIVYYRMFYQKANIRVPFDSVPGRGSVFYIYNSFSADTIPVGLYVAAGDSCNKESTPYYDQSTMFLRTLYDHCKYQSVLRWNAYRWYKSPGKPQHMTREYWIYYSSDGVNYNRIANTTDTHYVHPNVEPGKAAYYFVRVVNMIGSITSSSNRAHFIAGQTDSPGFVYLSSASVLDKTRIEIRVLVDTNVAMRGLDVQRFGTDSLFHSVGFLAYNRNASYSFIDEELETQKKSYSYRIVIRDSCDNPRGTSNISTTILLKVQENENDMFLKQLSWTPYSGFAGKVRVYKIYRVVNDVMDPVPVGSSDTLTLRYTDNLESISDRGAKIDYKVEAVEGLDNPYGLVEYSFSNPYPVYMEGGLFIPNAFSPQGVNSTWKPVTYFVEKTEYHVTVFNRWGRKVFETADDTAEWDGSGCLPDVYVYLIDYKNSRGEYMQLKGNVTLLR